MTVSRVRNRFPDTEAVCHLQITDFRREASTGGKLWEVKTRGGKREECDTPLLNEVYPGSRRSEKECTGD